MLRLIIKELASDYDGKTHQTYRTFDVELPEVEKFLSEKVGYLRYGSRDLIGCEVINTTKEVE